MKKTSILILIVPILLTSCASIFLPKNQKVTFKTNDKNSEVYLDNESIGKGKSITTKLNVKKGQSRQIVVEREGYKNQYTVITKERRLIAAYPLCLLSVATFYGIYIDGANYTKLSSYPREFSLKGIENNKLPLKSDEDKFISISNIAVSNEYKDKFIGFYVAKHSDNIERSINEAEKKQIQKQQ